MPASTALRCVTLFNHMNSGAPYSAIYVYILLKLLISYVGACRDYCDRGLTHIIINVCCIIFRRFLSIYYGGFSSPTPPPWTLFTAQRRETITVKGQTYFSRLPKSWPPIPISARRVCTPPSLLRGRTDSPGEEGDGGPIFWKTRVIGLPSYSKICTLCCSVSMQFRGCFHLHSRGARNRVVVPFSIW